MTPQEFDVIRAAIKSAYPTFNIMPDRYSIQLWYRMLGDIDFKICETALQELIATQTYPPQIAEIRAKCAEYKMPVIKDAGEAWGEVQKAIHRYGYYRSDEAMESLHGATKEAVQRIGFRELCMDDNPVANRAHFFKIYDAIIQRQVNESKVPALVLQKKEKYQLEGKGEEIAELSCSTDSVKSTEKSTQDAISTKRATPEFIDKLMREKGLR